MPEGVRRRWRIARGIHRRLLSVLFVAVVMGAGAGWALHASSRGGPSLTTFLVFGTTMLLLWPLAAVATFRIVRPMRDLAKVAGALREGELSRRTDLPENRPDEVGEVADALHDMAERVAGQLEDQQALMAAVSHELRSPLGRIRVLVELAREGMAPEDLHDTLQAEIDGMDALVGDLLAGSRIDFEAIKPVDQDAGDIALRALEVAGVDAGVLDVATDRSVRADPTLLVRGLRVMLDNAVRYGGRVLALRLRDDGDLVVFEVDDDGPGFADGEEEQAFEPFWRRPPETPTSGSGSERTGVGLGLALVRRIARAHGGDAGARNRADTGATVWISMPTGGRAE